ncbi:unnamed protein product [Amoebophrya sp. A120]|nr:unnamed protein product [Amoebophrya sp. A120]|eukprot:GSA120T00020776001.1
MAAITPVPAQVQDDPTETRRLTPEEVDRIVARELQKLDREYSHVVSLENSSCSPNRTVANVNSEDEDHHLQQDDNFIDPADAGYAVLSPGVDGDFDADGAPDDGLENNYDDEMNNSYSTTPIDTLAANLNNMQLFNNNITQDHATLVGAGTSTATPNSTPNLSPSDDASAEQLSPGEDGLLQIHVSGGEQGQLVQGEDYSSGEENESPLGVEAAQDLRARAAFVTTPFSGIFTDSLDNEVAAAENYNANATCRKQPTYGATNADQDFILDETAEINDWGGFQAADANVDGKDAAGGVNSFSSRAAKAEDELQKPATRTDVACAQSQLPAPTEKDASSDNHPLEKPDQETRDNQFIRDTMAQIRPQQPSRFLQNLSDAEILRMVRGFDP